MIRSVRELVTIETVEALEGPAGAATLVYRYWAPDGRLLGSRSETLSLPEPAAPAAGEEVKNP